MKEEGFDAFLAKLKNYTKNGNSLLHKPEKEVITEAFDLLVYLDKQVQLYVKKYHNAEKAKVDALRRAEYLEGLIDFHSSHCPLLIEIDDAF